MTKVSKKSLFKMSFVPDFSASVTFEKSVYSVDPVKLARQSKVYRNKCISSEDVDSIKLPQYNPPCFLKFYDICAGTPVSMNENELFDVLLCSDELEADSISSKLKSGIIASKMPSTTLLEKLIDQDKKQKGKVSKTLVELVSSNFPFLLDTKRSDLEELSPITIAKMLASEDCCLPPRVELNDFLVTIIQKDMRDEAVSFLNFIDFNAATGSQLIVLFEFVEKFKLDNVVKIPIPKSKRMPSLESNIKLEELRIKMLDNIDQQKSLDDIKNRLKENKALKEKELSSEQKNLDELNKQVKILDDQRKNVSDKKKKLKEKENELSKITKQAIGVKESDVSDDEINKIKESIKKAEERIKELQKIEKEVMHKEGLYKENNDVDRAIQSEENQIEYHKSLILEYQENIKHYQKKIDMYSKCNKEALRLIGTMKNEIGKRKDEVKGEINNNARFSPRPGGDSYVRPQPPSTLHTPN